MKRKFPRLDTDQQAEAFVANSDLSNHDLSTMRLVRFKLQPQGERNDKRDAARPRPKEESAR